MKPINTLRGQNSELLTVKVGSTYNCHWAFKRLRDQLTVMGNGALPFVLHCASSLAVPDQSAIIKFCKV
jgi:hypothetical protein